jgi:hypothetical protein
MHSNYCVEVRSATFHCAQDDSVGWMKDREETPTVRSRRLQPIRKQMQSLIPTSFSKHPAPELPYVMSGFLPPRLNARDGPGACPGNVQDDTLSSMLSPEHVRARHTDSNLVTFVPLP